jgi:imidazole glycerol-phosphate synthase subunit HisH
MIAIVDYGMGNLLSVYHALAMVGGDPKVCSRPEDLGDAERIVLPGVGAFRDCIAQLRAGGFAEALEEQVRRRGKPLLGICLGLQALARRSFEGGEYQGLGWIDGDVVRIQPADPTLRVPQVGWNDVAFRGDSRLFAGLRRPSDFYFVHSYHLRCERPEDVEATCDYGGAVTAAVRRGNIVATQFHPEKSQDHGLRLLENFLKWRP